MIKAKVKRYGGHYDVRSGTVTSVALKGNVNQFKNTITIEQINSKTNFF